MTGNDDDGSNGNRTTDQSGGFGSGVDSDDSDVGIPPVILDDTDLDQFKAEMKPFAKYFLSLLSDHEFVEGILESPTGVGTSLQDMVARQIEFENPYFSKNDVHEVILNGRVSAARKSVSALLGSIETKQDAGDYASILRPILNLTDEGINHAKVTATALSALEVLSNISGDDHLTTDKLEILVSSGTKRVKDGLDAVND